MWVRFPARITFTEGNIGPCQLESGADSICHIVACGQDRTALAGFDTDDIVRFHLDRSQISRCFYQSGDVLTHGINTVSEHGEGAHGHVEDAHEDVKDARGYGEDTHVYEDHEGVPELHAYDDRDGHEMDIEYDEHIWTSPVNAQAIVKIISQTLMEAAPADSSRFKANADAYIEELKELDGRFRQVVAQGRPPARRSGSG